MEALFAASDPGAAFAWKALILYNAFDYLNFIVSFLIDYLIVLATLVFFMISV